jgi:hypothetical protein
VDCLEISDPLSNFLSFLLLIWFTRRSLNFNSRVIMIN